MPTKNLYFFLFIFSVVINACNLINPAEPTPSYLEIKKSTVSSNYIKQGTNSSKVQDAWVYINGQLLGIYQLPCKIPVLQSGTKEIQIGAGILMNGISSTRESYPLYKLYTTNVELTPGQTSTIDTAAFSYFPDLEYTWYEDFENDTSGGGISMDTTSSSLANLQIESTNVFEGQRCLKLEVNSSQNVIECQSVGDGYTLPRGRDTYIELNYKCDQEFTIGLKGITSSDERYIPVLVFNPITYWNKIYINISKFINANTDVSKFKVYFYEKLTDGASNGVVYIDNVKLISN